MIPAHIPTLVTALFDLGRGRVDNGLAEYQRRPFAEYLAHFRAVLSLDAPLCVYTEPDLADMVMQARGARPTRLILHPLVELRQRFAFYDAVQSLRVDPAWRAQAGWLAESPQAQLPDYNPLVMSKLAMLNDQQLQAPFGSEHYLWIDAGLARTCGAYLGNPLWLARIGRLLTRFLFLCYPYQGASEIHGYERNALAQLSGTDHVGRVARGGLFGGAPSAIAEANALYCRLMEISFARGHMGTEESLFSAMSYLRPDLIDRFQLGADGLIGPFFQSLLGQAAVPIVRTDVLAPRCTPSARPRAGRSVESIDLAVYMLTFNQPRQLELLIRSWQQQPDTLHGRSVTVLDNSTDPEARAGNRILCERFGLRHLPQPNLGICGGRQKAAELFEDSAHDYMLFLEDDMLMAGPDAAPCQAGMNRWVDGLVRRVLQVMEQEQFDFLKLSFSEFYGINSEQWAWFNVPAAVRAQVWPAHPAPCGMGGDKIPPTVFSRIGVHDGLAYATGEVYYSNWPQIVSRDGNRRMFLEERWEHPFEQTWMSHFFQLTRRGLLRPAVLLASPIEHRREFHYPREQRLES